MTEAVGRSPRRPRRRTPPLRSSGCAGTYTNSTRSWSSPPARSTGLSGSTALAGDSLGRSRTVLVRIARELLGRCRSLTRTILALDRELQARIEPTAPALLTLPGCGALSAAKLLGEIGPIERFQTDAQLARHAGVAPLEASSGKHRRHRLDRGGNRQLNCALHRIAITQATHPPARTRLPRPQTERRQEPPRSPPLPQTTTRPHRPHHPQKRAAIDIGATPAQSSARGPRRDYPMMSTATMADSRGASVSRKNAIPSSIA